MMPLTITPERYAAIRQAIRERRSEKLAAEIATTDWSDLRRYDLHDFLMFLDTIVKAPESPASRSPIRR